jgi:hypothetical protein
MAELNKLMDPLYGAMRNAMIAALCCVVPFLCEYVTNVTTPFITRVNISMFSHKL